MDIEKVKEFIKDKKNRAFVTLGLYVIFFIFVGVVFRTYKSEPLSSEANPSKEVTPIEAFCLMANYEYSYLYNDEVTIEGKVFRTDNYFEINDDKYYKKNNIIYLYNDDTFTNVDIDYKIYDVKELCEFYNNAKLVSKSEDYETKVIMNKYSFSSSLIDNDSDELVYITLYELDNAINKVDLDLTNYIDTKVSIDYSNIGQVKNFTNMFSEDKIIKGVE